MKKDIQQRADVEQMVSSFYRKAVKDEIIGSKFDHIELDEHLPLMFDFWSSLLHGDSGYFGNAFDKHKPLDLEAVHFERWLSIFEQNIDEQFEGEKAELAKQRANNIGAIFLAKINYLKQQP